MNDDLVQPDRGKVYINIFHVDSFNDDFCKKIGFGEHPHRDAEICTYIVRGKLTHQDSMGTSETLGRGAIQFMVSVDAVLVAGISLTCYFFEPFLKRLPAVVSATANIIKTRPTLCALFRFG